MARTSVRSHCPECIELICTYVTRLILLFYMDRFSFQEAVLAEYIGTLKSYSRDELVSELIDVKFGQLEKLSDEALIVELNVQRRKQES